MENPPSQKKPKREAKQQWPFVRKRVYPSGAVSWTVDARTKTGGKKMVYGTRAEAETHAEQCRTRRGNEGVAAFGNEELARFGKSVQDAISFYLDHLRQQERSIPLETAISELVSMRRSAGKSKRYCHDLELRLGRVGKSFAGRTVASFGSKELDEWLAGLPVAPGTRNTFRRDLRTLFSFCHKRGYAATNPAAATERAKDVGGAPVILTVDEARRVLDACGDDVLPYNAIGLFAGLRSAELEKLDWSEVDLAGGYIEVTAQKAKTARRRLVKIEPTLRAWLTPLVQSAGPIAPVGLRKRLDAARRRAGFAPVGSETAEERKAGTRLKPWPQNALRHSFGSYWLAEHRDTAALALQMGNSQAMIFAHYRELVKPSDASRFWQLAPEPEASKKLLSFAA